eukprot:428780_1
MIMLALVCVAVFAIMAYNLSGSTGVDHVGEPTGADAEEHKVGAAQSIFDGKSIVGGVRNAEEMAAVDHVGEPTGADAEEHKVGAAQSIFDGKSIVGGVRNAEEMAAVDQVGETTSTDSEEPEEDVVQSTKDGPWVLNFEDFYGKSGVKTFTVEVESGDVDVKTLELKIQEKTGIKTYRQRLAFPGVDVKDDRYLKKGRTLKSYNIQ